MGKIINIQQLTPFDIFHLGVTMGAARSDRWYAELFGDVPECMKNISYNEMYDKYEKIIMNIHEYVSTVLFSPDGVYGCEKCGAQTLYEMFVQPVIKEEWEYRVLQRAKYESKTDC